MPREYEAIRDSLLRRRKSLKTPKSIAAPTYNKRHASRPLSSYHERKKTEHAMRKAFL